MLRELNEINERNGRDISSVKSFIDKGDVNGLLIALDGVDLLRDGISF